MFVGIDLGTTNSALAVLDSAGRPDIVPNAEGDRVTPSVVFFEPGSRDRVIVGQAARDNAVIYGDRVFEAFKRRMATGEPFSIDASQVTPVELSSFVLRKLANDARQQLGQITRAVITVPANFTNEARLATIEAGKLAGLEVSHIVNEPTAAVFYYSHLHPISGKVVVYDFGGGTLDVTVAAVEGRDVEILVSKGDPRLGGIDFDQRLRDVIERSFLASTGTPFDPNVHQLAKTVEEYKKQLSAREETAVQVTGGTAGRTILSLSRQAFEGSTSTLISKAELLVESTLDEAGLKPSDVSQVFMVGGSTRMPSVRRHLTAMFGKPPVCYVNPDEVVALGAALYSGFNAGIQRLNPAQASAVQAMRLKEIANHHFGTISLNDDPATGTRRQLNSILIEKNTALPCSKTESYYTIHPGQTQVRCLVTQSATRESDPDFVRVIWDGTLGPLPPGRPAGMEIRVTYSYDTNQIMHCIFEDVATGRRQEIDISPQGAGRSTTGGGGIERFLVE